MTLKKCTVTQLDDVFWRVDYGTVTRILRSDSSGRLWYEDHGGAARWPSLDDALAAHGLTRHNHKPETAEERVRKLVGEAVDDGHGGAVVDMLAAHVIYDDLRAILAELDRLRETSEALLASLRAANAVAQHCQGERDDLVKELDRALASYDKQAAVAKYATESADHWRDSAVDSERKCEGLSDEVLRLRAQPPVDVEAVLAPIRKVREDFAKRIEYSKECAHSASHERRHDDAERAHGQQAAYADAEFELRHAIAEAEKIGRGE